MCECVRQGQTEWPCLCIFAASRVQDGGCHQLWSSSRNNQQQQQLQQRGSSASGVSGGGVCYIVCMCFCFGHLFLFVGYLKLGVKLIIPPNEIRRLDKKQNVFFSKEIKCREFASLWSPQCVDYPANSSHPKQIIGKQNLRKKKSVGMQFVIDYCRHL